MTRIIEILAVIILILLIISMAAMPWPANVILGSIALISSIMAFAYSWLAKKRERDINQNEKADR